MGTAITAVLSICLGALNMDYKQQIVNAANRHGVPPEIALAVAQRESGIRQYDSSGNVIARYEPRLGESSLGIFQLLQSTARELGVNPSDPGQNIEGGVRYLAQMYRATGDWQQALAAYNGGIGNWQRGTVSSAAQGYASAVMSDALHRAAATGGALPTHQQVQSTMTAWNPFEGFAWPGLTVSTPSMAGTMGATSPNDGWTDYLPILALGIIAVLAFQTVG